MTVHYLKIKPEYYKDVECGLKKFELRKNDRNFQVGDILMLIKLDSEGNETDQVIRVKVNYILKDCPQYGLKDGYAILGIDTGNRIGGTVTLSNGDVVATMKENEDIKQRIDDAEKELRELFNDLIYEHCDNEGEYQLNNLTSGFNTLLKYAREWQKNGEH